MQRLLQFVNKYSKYFFALIFIIIILFPKFPFIRIPSTYVSIRIEDFLILILGIVTLIYSLPNLKHLFKDKLLMSLVLFVLVGFASTFSGIFLTQTVDFKIGILHLFRRVEYMTPFVAMLVLFKNRPTSKKIEYYTKILMIITTLVFLYGLGQRYFNFPVIITQNEEYSKGVALRWTPGAHINSTFAGHYDMASFLVLAFPIFALLFVFIKDIKSRLVLLVPIVSSLWLLQASVSRISIVSWFIATSLSLYIFKKYKEILILALIAFLLVLSSPGLMGRYQRFIDVYKQKILSFKVVSEAQAISGNVVVTLYPVATTSPSPAPSIMPTPVPVFEDRSTNIRLAVEWPRAIRAFEKNPLFGTGYSSITLATDNDYLRIIGETGIFGLLAFILLFSKIFTEIINGVKNINKYSLYEKVIIASTISALVGTFITAIFIDIFEASKFSIIMWSLLGMAIITVRNKIDE